jgi:FkbM family methyltransferase
MKFAPGATIVDIGANVGVFSVLVAAANPQARIIAIEPGRTNCAFLSRNILTNGLSNVAIVPSACGGKKGEGTLYGREEGVHYSLFNRNWRGSQFSRLYEIGIVTLQDVFDQFEVSTCDLLKIDCEGAEYDILFGSSPDTLRIIKRISMEYHVGFNEHSIEALEQFLVHHGFVVERSPLDVEEGTGMLYALNQASSPS